MGLVGRIIGYMLWVGAGILMFFFWLLALSKWLGFFGTFLAFAIAPGLVVFPLVFWIVEGIFPTFYFIIWGIGLVGMVITRISSGGDQA